MIEERINELIKRYESQIYENRQKIKVKSEVIVYRLKHNNNNNNNNYIKCFADDIEELRKENELLAIFIDSLKYAKEGN